MDWLDPLAVQGTHKSLLQHYSSKASIFRCSAFFTVPLSHPYGRNINKLIYADATTLMAESEEELKKTHLLGQLNSIYITISIAGE